MLTHRRATAGDLDLLAEMNLRLIRDEGHRNAMSVAELKQRMAQWLSGEYVALIFEEDGFQERSAVVAYALYAEREDEIYLRQLFVARERRRQGIGRWAVAILRSEVWPQTKRLTVEVLVRNAAAVAFWRAVGYADYCLTLEILPGTKPC
jgi:GNAT superfamily N-acetyltransferase